MSKFNTTVKNRINYPEEQIIEYANYILEDRISKISNSIQFKYTDKNELKKYNRVKQSKL